MKKIILFTGLFFIAVHFVSAQEFQKTIGGPLAEFCWSVNPIGNDGFLIVGNSPSIGPGGVYVIKVDANGDTIWTKSLGGNSGEYGLFANETINGGYLAGGKTYSFGIASPDGYVVNIDSNNNVLWSKTYGGIYNDEILNVLPTFDNGYLMMGTSSSFGSSNIDFDIYLIKADNIGDTLWTRVLSGPGSVSPLCMQRAGNNGFIISGYCDSLGAGQNDAFLIRIDSVGNVMWAKTYGGPDTDVASFVIQTLDGGFAACGKSHSFGALDGNLYLIRTNENGDTLWTKTYGGAGTDWGNVLLQNADGGFTIAGETYSFGAGSSDALLMQTDSLGHISWANSYGGTLQEHFRGIQTSSDGGFIMAGYSSSFGAGNGDIYLVKTDVDGNSYCNEYGGLPNEYIPATEVANAPFNTLVTNTIVTSPLTLSGHGGIISSLCNNVDVEEEYGFPSFQIYPNPTTGILNISGNSSSLMTIFDMQGKTIMEKMILPNEQINLPNMPNGLYLIKIKNDHVLITTKFILNK